MPRSLNCLLSSRGGSRGAEEAPAPPTAQNSMEPLTASLKILEIIDEGREGTSKKKGHRPPCLLFLASPLIAVVNE